MGFLCFESPFQKMAGKIIREIFSKSLLKNAAKRVFPDPMDHYRLELMLWDFKDPETSNNWVTITDKQFGGLSTAELTRSKSGKALFRGELSTDLPPGSEAKHSGICAIRSQPRVVSITYECFLNLFKHFIT